MLNRVIIMGRLTADPELRNTQSGTAVASFSLAVDRDFKGQDGERETDFVSCVAWRNTASFASKYFSKGQMACVEGRLQVRDWSDKDGAKRRTTEVVVENLYFAGSRPGEAKPAQSYTPAPGGFREIPEDEEGELPF